MRKRLTATVAGAVFLFSVSGTGLAASTGTHGQPGQSCENPATSTTPGNADNPSNTGSPFSPNGHSGDVYADGAWNRRAERRDLQPQGRVAVRRCLFPEFIASHTERPRRAWGCVELALLDPSCDASSESSSR